MQEKSRLQARVLCLSFCTQFHAGFKAAIGSPSHTAQLKVVMEWTGCSSKKDNTEIMETVLLSADPIHGRCEAHQLTNPCDERYAAGGIRPD